MDLSALDPKASLSTTGQSRRHGDGGNGFRGVMALMTHLDTARAPRADEGRRAADTREPRPDERRPIDKPAEKAANEPPVERANSPAASDPAASSADTPAAAPLPELMIETVANTETFAAGNTTVDTPVVDMAAAVPPIEPDASVPLVTLPAPIALASRSAEPAAPATAGLLAEAGEPADLSALAKAPAEARPASTPSAATPSASTPQANPAPAAPAPAPEAATAPTARQAASPTPSTSAGSGPVPMPAQITVEPAAVVARSQGVSAAALVQVQLASAGDAAGKAVTSATQTASPLHVGGGQPLFVGADGGSAQGGSSQNDGNGQANGGQQNGNQQNGNQQNGGQQNQGQASAGVMFGAASIGQRGFGGAAARAQFQEILATRTARAPAQAAVGAGTSSLSTPLTAGPGGPQSTFGTAMASRAEATAQGRPGALPGTVVDQVALKLASSARDGGSRVTIRLNPEELGKVDVRLQLGRDGLVRATVSVEKPETLDMLQRDARALEKALQDAGLRTDRNSLEFNLQGGDRSPQQHQDQRDAMAGSPAVALADDPSTDNPAADMPTGGDGGQRADGSYDLVA